jgi:hypothetical protein
MKFARGLINAREVRNRPKRVPHEPPNGVAHRRETPRTDESLRGLSKGPNVRILTRFLRFIKRGTRDVVLETVIHAVCMRVRIAATLPAGRAACRHLALLISRRSPERVAAMGRARGLYQEPVR